MKRFGESRKSLKNKELKNSQFPKRNLQGVLQKAASESMERSRSKMLTNFKMFLSSTACIDEFHPGPKIHHDYGIF